MKQALFGATMIATLSVSAIAAPKPAAKAAARSAAPAPAQQPTARYAMDVGTTTGLAAMSMNMGGALSMAFGGGANKEARELHLRLGSSLTASGAPKADHFFLPPARLGKSVPLLSPEKTVTQDEQSRERIPQQFQRPRGRLLIFWGCGEHAPKGQPVVIDFTKLAAGQAPPNLFSTNVPIDRGPDAANSKTFGEWPNRAGTKPPSKDSSLLGAHRIASTYAPEINFTLAQDYMPGVFVKSSPTASGAIILSWNSVAAATGYYAWTFGATMDGKEAKDLVWWSSSSAREFGGGLWDWLAPATVARLVGSGIVLPPAQTQCLIPAEVKAASPSFMFGNMNAYGPQADFAFPPRPSSGPWKPEWTARVRYRANSSFLIGGPPGMSGAEDGAEPAKPRKCRGGILGAAIGVC